MEHDKEQSGTWITIQLSSEANELITRSCSNSVRSKKMEAKIRLEDHLKRFASIAEIGKAEERK